MDVLACHAAVQQAAYPVRNGGGLPGVRTYRFRHSMFDPGCTAKSEVEHWQERDPVRTFTRRCLARGALTDDDVAAIRRAANDELDDAVAYAEAGT